MRAPSGDFGCHACTYNTSAALESETASPKFWEGWYFCVPTHGHAHARTHKDMRNIHKEKVFFYYAM